MMVCDEYLGLSMSLRYHTFIRLQAKQPASEAIGIGYGLPPTEIRVKFKYIRNKTALTLNDG